MQPSIPLRYLHAQYQKTANFWAGAARYAFPGAAVFGQAATGGLVFPAGSVIPNHTLIRITTGGGRSGYLEFVSSGSVTPPNVQVNYTAGDSAATIAAAAIAALRARVKAGTFSAGILPPVALAGHPAMVMRVIPSDPRETPNLPVGQLLNITPAVLFGRTVALENTQILDLGEASTFAAFGHDLTGTAAPVITGNVGAFAAQPTGIAVPTSGQIYSPTLPAGPYPQTIVDTISNAIALAISEGLGRASTATIASALGGVTQSPGVYDTAAGFAIAAAGTLTLDAGGDPDATFIFRCTTLSIGNTANIALANGARASNVFFVCSGAVTVGTGATVNGSILTLGTITAGASTVNGRLLSELAAVALTTTTIAGFPSPEPLPLGFVGAGWALAKNAILENMGIPIPISHGPRRIALANIPPREG